jgi:hypothetical protein
LNLKNSKPFYKWKTYTSVTLHKISTGCPFLKVKFLNPHDSVVLDSFVRSGEKFCKVSHFWRSKLITPALDCVKRIALKTWQHECPRFLTYRSISISKVKLLNPHDSVVLDSFVRSGEKFRKVSHFWGSKLITPALDCVKRIVLTWQHECPRFLTYRSRFHF